VTNCKRTFTTQFHITPL